MSLSDEKITHLTHVLLKELLDRDVITPTTEEGDIRREMRRIIVRQLQVNADIPTDARFPLDGLA